jgi:hypothetical protein
MEIISLSSLIIIIAYSTLFLFNEKFRNYTITFFMKNKKYAHLPLTITSILIVSVFLETCKDMIDVVKNISSGYHSVNIPTWFVKAPIGLSFLVINFTATEYGSRKMLLLWKKNTSKNLGILFISSAIFLGLTGFTIRYVLVNQALEHGYTLCEQGDYSYVAPGIHCDTVED